MRLLLDTQAFLWYSADDPRIGRTARDLISEGSNEVFFSVVTSWEIAIKHANGRMPEVVESAGAFIQTRIAHFGFSMAPIQLQHTLTAGILPLHHRDPFDRMLVAQAQVEGLAILTSDANIKRYDVEVIW